MAVRKKKRTKRSEASRPVVSFLNTDKQKQAASELAHVNRQREDLARFPQENPNPVLRVDRDGSILFANAACSPLDFFKCQPGQLLPERYRQVVAEVLDTGSHQIIEAEGKERVFTLDFVPITGAGYVNIYGNDVTKRKRAEEDLSQTRDYLDNLFTYANAPIIVWNPESEITRFNHAFERLTGRTAGEVLGKKLDILFPDESRDESMKHISEATSGERWEVIEIPIQHVDGYIRTVLWNSATLFDDDGKTPVATIAQGQDITERKWAEEALREAEKDLNRAQAVAQIGSWRLDVQCNELLWSDECHRIFGIPKGTPMTYETFLSCVHPEDREYVDSKWQAALQGEEYDIEHRITVGDEVKWIRERAELEFDRQDMLKGGFGTAQDITARKKAEERINFQSVLLDNIEDSILATDAEGRITFWGRGTVSLLNWQSDEVIGLDVADVLFPDESSEEAEVIKKVLRSGHSWSGEIAVRRRDGALVPLLARSSPVLDKDGRMIGAVAVGKDITELKRVDRMKDEFIGLVSHELRTPLTIITGSLRSAMSAGVSPEDARELLQNAVEGADSLAVILENMLELSRHQAGRLQLHLEPVSITGLAQGVVGKVSSQGAVQRFMLDFPPDLPPVEADPVRVERVLYNLVENATKYSSAESEVKVSGRTEGDFVVTEVADQGQGISPDDQNKLFELFERLEKPSLTEGVGLGLVVCKRLLEAQGGWIKVRSEPGKGSTFAFALPIYQTKA
jgi:PAS domain S-box-containing protein